MKFFNVFAVAVVLCLAAAVRASGYGGGAAAPASGGYGGGAAAHASGGYGGGSVSIPAPPCPKNYLFSCVPNLSPAPCSPAAAGGAGGYGGAGGAGSVGAYSENYPVYAVPQYINGFQSY